MFSFCKSPVIKFVKKTLKIIYATSSCSIRTKNKAKQRPGNTNVTIGLKIGGKNDAVITILFIYLNLHCNLLRSCNNLVTIN